jgi:diguanylate cyclase (GGDEF)-like protein/PAS domain S-box-containing protein
MRKWGNYPIWFQDLREGLTLLPRRLSLMSLAVMVGLPAASSYRLERSWVEVRHDDEQAQLKQALIITDDFNKSLWQVNAKINMIISQSGDDRDPVFVQAKMAEAIRLMPDVLAALLSVDYQGRVMISSTGRFKSGTDLSGLDAFKAAVATHDMAFSAPIMVDGVQWLPVARPVQLPGGQKHIGFTMLRLAYFQKNLASEQLGPSNQLAIFELNGPEILRSPAPPPGADLWLAGRRLTQELGSGESSSAIATSPLDHITRLSVVMRAGGAPLGVLVAVPVTVLWQSWWPQALLIISGAVALLAMMLAFHFALAIEMRNRSEAEAKSERIAAQNRLLTEYSSDALIEVGFKDGFRYTSPATERMFGWTTAELVGIDPRTTVHPADLQFMNEEMDGPFPDSGRKTVRFRYLCKDGHYLWVEAAVQLTKKNGVPDGFVSVMRDISDRVEAERKLADAMSKLEHLAVTDQLTGLANRRRFDQELEREWRRAARDHSALSLLLIDADFFKLYNDTYGHQAGDDVLQTIAATTAAALHRSGDLVARWGGEEFVVLLPNTEIAGAATVAEHTRAAVEALAIKHKASPKDCVTISIGVACRHPGLDQASESLLAEADTRLYEAKRRGRNRVSIPSNEIDRVTPNSKLG